MDRGAKRYNWAAYYAAAYEKERKKNIVLAEQIVSALPVFLAFAAGAMIYVVAEELIPEAQAGTHSNIGTVGVAVGFVIMMILDVALG